MHRVYQKAFLVAPYHEPYQIASYFSCRMLHCKPIHHHPISLLVIVEELEVPLPLEDLECLFKEW